MGTPGVGLEGAVDLLPVGIIVAWAGSGDVIPAGWLLCDGGEVPAGSKLGQVLLKTWGEAKGAGMVKLPDLRGWFLRGADHGSGRDPGALDNRHALALGGNPLGKGSIQEHAVGSHHHRIPLDSGPGIYQGSAAAGGKASPLYEIVAPVDGAGPETRPANVSVDYIIKAI